MMIDSYVLNLFPSTSTSTSDALLGTLYGTGSATSGSDPLPALQQAETNQTTSVARVAKQPDVARDIAAFRKAVAAAKTPADLLANPQALKVLLTANGLGDQTDYTALAKKALLSDTSKPNSLASQLPDTRWSTVAKTYDFANKGLKIIQNAKALDGIANGYAQLRWQTSLDETTPGLSSALDFRSRASTITSVDQILGDPTFRSVVTTALGIPKQIAFQSLATQENVIRTRIDITKFKDPKFVETFAKQFLIANAANASATSSSSPGLLGLFA